MDKYIVNHIISGYSSKEITDVDLLDGVGNLVVVVIDESLNNDLQLYYNSVIDIIMSRNKLVLITVGEECSISKAICSLLASYRNYNIYNVLDKEIIDNEYISEVLNRKPGYNEVSTFIGGDITAYSEINTIVMGIDNLIKDGDIDGLKVFLEKHLSSISKFTAIVDYMKTIVENSNTGDMQSKIEEMTKSLEELKNKYNETKELYDKSEEVKKALEGSVQAFQGELKSALSKVDELQNMDKSDKSVIKTYESINTASIKCKTKLILYFKEVTQIPYINSLVTNLAHSAVFKHLKFKVVIYDDRASLSRVYKPLNVIGSTEYLSKREAYSVDTAKFVVIEPNPVILNDILIYSTQPNDVVIIYDRMRQVNDLVIGNNVTKFFVLNSYSDYMATKDVLKITDLSSIITLPGSRIGTEVLDIPFIADYKQATDAKKKNLYNRATTQNSNKQLMRTIFDKIRLEALIKVDKK